ncbi:MAG: aldo/keto reductase [candidate division WS1 bacterium]|jgi:aryl-alcohol dehydrogenase-like predicted oxidoreductase|nr:aldo/keto reductase [candidate division WS1 bacterium]
MDHVQLGRTGCRISRFCLGTMNIRKPEDEEPWTQIVGEALDGGINFIDTANVYGRGLSETVTGNILAASGRRDEVVLATKAVAPMGDGPNDRGANRYHLTRSVEASLKRLQTDRIDLFYLHVVDLSTPMDEILETLNTLIQQGKLLYIGTSKWPPTLIMEGLALAEARGLPRFVAEQPPYHILDRGIENELLWMARRQGIGVCSWGPLAYGLLSGKYRKGEKPYEGGRFASHGPDSTRFTEEALDVVEALIPLAEARGITLAQFAHAWMLSRPVLNSVLIGPRTIEQFRGTMEAYDIELTEEELARVDELVPPGRFVSNFYDGNVYERMRRSLADPKAY